MGEFMSESVILRLKEHWHDVASPIALSGVGKLVDFYEGLLSRNQKKTNFINSSLIH